MGCVSVKKVIYMISRTSIYIAISVLMLIFIFACGGESNTVDLSNYLDQSNLPVIRDGKLIQISSYDTTGGNNDRINIKAGKTAEILNFEGPGMISRIWITIDSRDPYFLRRIMLRFYWDDETHPSVEVPVGDFFGNGFEYTHYTSRYLGMSSGGYYCYFPMPFNKNARVEVVNDTGEEVFAFYYQFNVYKFEKPLSSKTGYFHAAWKRDLRTNYDSNYVALEAEGRGQFVGLNFNGQPYSGSLFYLEGDEMIYVDGELVPSTHGTGMEDYFTSGWYFKNGEFNADFHGLIFKDDATGRVAAYRHHIPDAIPFKKSIKVTFEHGHANEQVADFATTAFWYQLEPHKPWEPLLKPSLRIPLRRPVPEGAFEAEDAVLIGNVRTKVEDMSDHGPDWSGLKQLLIEGEKGDEFELTIPELREAKYHVDVYPTKGPDYGFIDIFSDDVKVASFDGFDERITPFEKFRIPDLKTNDGNLTLSFRIPGKNKSSRGYNAGLDAFVLVPDREYIPEWYMIGPFPNKRESDYVRLGLDSVYAPEKEIILDKTYIGVDEQEIGWEKIDGRDGGYGMGLWRMYDPYEFVVCYALTYIYSPEDQEVPFMFSSDDGSKVFLNDEQLYRFLEVRVASPDDEEIPLQLRKGWNKLLLKVENNFGGYAFYARVIDRNKNLVFSRDKKMK